MPVLDAHAHVVPEALLRDTAASSAHGVVVRAVPDGWSVEVPGAGPRLVRAGMARSALRERYCQTHRIDDQLLSPWLDVQPTERMAAPAARGWAHRLNEAVLADTDGHGPGALASVALNDTAQASRDLEQAVAAGMVGLVLATEPAHCRDLADPRLDPLWDVAQGLGVPVMVHPTASGPARAVPDSADFANAYCRPVDTSFAVARLILGGVLDRFPALRLITVHGGGFLPYQAGRLDGAHRADALASRIIERGRPSDYLGDLFFDTATLSSTAIRFLVDTVGPDHVLLGTDHPFPLGDPDPVGTVEAAALEQADQALVLGGALQTLVGVSARV